MKVCKFGGSSLSSAAQVEKVCRILLKDSSRKIAVVSAPGKNRPDDVKITDLLIQCATLRLQGQPADSVLTKIIEKYREIADGFRCGPESIREIEEDLCARISAEGLEAREYMDYLKAAGEDNMAKLVAACLRKTGANARYVSPREAGLKLSDDFGNAAVLEESYVNLAKLRGCAELIVFPGFFGTTRSGKVITFPRGGSDITGAILAAAVSAEVYENYTDVDYVYSADPRVVADPRPIYSLTFREMRELSCAGFNVLQDETLIPVEHANIPIHLLNTNNPLTEGTYITGRKFHQSLVTGIAATENFCILTVYKRLMSRKPGFLKRVLDIFYEERLPIEHMPTSVDSLSLILRESVFSPPVRDKVLSRIRDELSIDEFEYRDRIALVTVVGENMNNHVGVLAKISAAIAGAAINIIAVSQGASQHSIILGVKNEDSEKAVRAIYDALIR